MKTVKIFTQLKSFSLLLVALSLTASFSLAQGTGARTGKILGTVLDAETGETIPGANVLVVGTTRGDETDIDGYYTIGGLQPSIYYARPRLPAYGSC